MRATGAQLPYSDSIERLNTPNGFDSVTLRRATPMRTMPLGRSIAAADDLRRRSKGCVRFSKALRAVAQREHAYDDRDDTQH